MIVVERKIVRLDCGKVVIEVILMIKRGRSTEYFSSSSIAHRWRRCFESYFLENLLHNRPRDPDSGTILWLVKSAVSVTAVTARRKLVFD